MSINLEQIDALRERANISYEEAKEVLEKCNNDVVEALIYLEKQKGTNASTKKEHDFSAFKNGVKDLLKKGNETKFVVKKNDNTVLNIPVNFAVISTVIVPPVAIAGVAAALLTNHSIKFEKPNGEDMEINKVFDKMSTAVTTATTQVVDAINKKEDQNK